MAGSQREQAKPNPTIIDPVLSARLESVKLLAERLSEPVAIIDRKCNVVYANRFGRSHNLGRLSGGSPTKCYAAFFGRSQRCSVCPAQEVFDSGKRQSVLSSTGEDLASCRIVQAYPLLSADGTPEFVLEVFGESMCSAYAEQPPGHSRVRPDGSHDPGQTRLGSLIGHSAPMRYLFEMIRLVADSQATVLLQGESGTGKELVARTIHDLSCRRDRPFVVVDCGSLPESLLESELFGHVRGAFTGALVSKKGLFEEADGGTIFLDEIADTSGHFQSKLLRVLQEGEVKPVGSSRSIKVDVRIISSTNKGLEERVEAKTFREDLYYRLAVLPLFLPALQERREDVPLLVEHFVEAACLRHRKPLRMVTPEAMSALVEAPWPGNVRELQHMIERVVVTAPGPELGPQDFFGTTGSSAQAVPESDLHSVARTAMRSAERGRIQEAIHQAAGNKAMAARTLKISRASLYNKLRAYQIEWSSLRPIPPIPPLDDDYIRTSL